MRLCLRSTKRTSKEVEGCVTMQRGGAPMRLLLDPSLDHEVYTRWSALSGGGGGSQAGRVRSTADPTRGGVFALGLGCVCLIILHYNATV